MITDDANMLSSKEIAALRLLNIFSVVIKIARSTLGTCHREYSTPFPSLFMTPTTKPAIKSLQAWGISLEKAMAAGQPSKALEVAHRMIA